MMRLRSEDLRAAISVGVGLQIGAFFLHGHARLESDGEKGASAEGDELEN